MIHLINETLNVNNQRYYYASVSQLLDYFTSTDTQITEDNYRLNNNILRVAISTTFTIATAITKNTVIQTLGTNNEYQRVYNILSYEIQSGYIQYNVAVDLWHTYIYTANPTNLRVCRSTRAIVDSGIYKGFYSAPKQAIGTPKYIPLDVKDGGISIVDANNRIGWSHWNLVLALKYNYATYQSGSISTTRLFAFNLNYLLTNIHDKSSGTWIKSIASIIIDYISGIYQITQETTDDSYTTPCEVVNAWLVDDKLIDRHLQTYGPPWTAHVWSKMYYTTLINGFYLTPDYVSSTNLTSAEFERSFTYDNAKPNCKYYVGTNGNYMEIGANYGEMQFNIRAIVGSDNLKIILIQGENQIDITSAFSLNYTAVDGNLTMQRQMVDQMQNLLPLLASTGTIATGVITENPIAVGGGILSLANSAVATMNRLLPQRSGTTIKAGDAISNLCLPWNLLLNQEAVSNPYYIIEIEDEYTGQKELETKGLVYDYTVPDLAALFTYYDATTGTATVGTIDGYDYLQITEATFSGNVPREAIEYIYSKLLQGIRIKITT